MTLCPPPPGCHSTTRTQPYFAMDITFTTSGKRPITASWPATILSEICDALDKEAGLAKGAASKASPAAPIRPQAVSA